MNKDQNPENSECGKFLKLLGLILDDEADEVEKSYLKDHVENCNGCFEQLEIERELKELIKTKLENKSVPEDLIQSIRGKINSLV